MYCYVMSSIKSIILDTDYCYNNDTDLFDKATSSI